MTAAAFLKLVVALLAEHSHHSTRQTLWNWKTGKTPVPEFVEVILERDAV
jgi:hypothetical protein